MTAQHFHLNHQQPTMEHAIVAILQYVRAMASWRDDAQLQYFLLVDVGDEVQILSIDAGTWPDFGDAGLQAVAGLAHALHAEGAVFVERGARDAPISIDVHLRGRARGLSYRLLPDPNTRGGFAGHEVGVSNQPFDIVPSADVDGRATGIWARLDAAERGPVGDGVSDPACARGCEVGA